MRGEFTNRVKADAAEREVRQRQRVYAHQVAAGKMTQEFADVQIRIMQEVTEDYRALVHLDPPPAQGSLL